MDYADNKAVVGFITKEAIMDHATRLSAEELRSVFLSKASKSRVPQHIK